MVIAWPFAGTVTSLKVGIAWFLCPCTAKQTAENKGANARSQTTFQMRFPDRAPICYRSRNFIEKGTRMPPWLCFVLVGLAVGSIAGMLGIGGGVLIIPALVFLFAFPQKLA